MIDYDLDLRSRGGGGGRAPLVMLGGSGWDVANLLGTASGAGIVGSAVSGVFAEALVQFNALPGASQYVAAELDGANTAGWFLWSNAAGKIAFHILDGAVSIASPTWTVGAADLGKVHRLSGVWDAGASLLRLLVDGVEIGAGTPAATYLPPVAAQRTNLGTRNNGTAPFLPGTIFSAQGGSASPSQAEIAAAYATDQQTGEITAIAGKTSHRWVVGLDAVPPNFPALLKNQENPGVGNMSFWFGSAAGIALDTITNPEFG